MKILSRAHLRNLLVFLLQFILLSVAYAQQHRVNDFSDRILKFHSDINVQANGKIAISEYITVYNGDGEDTPGYDKGHSFYYNNDIKRGIVRDFPTRYKDSSGFWSQTGFDIKGVYKNDEKEPYITETLVNGTRIKIGKEEVTLAPGIYRYRIDYETDRQLIYHNDKDELYWNVNGNGWVFTTDTVSCTVHFPEGAVIKEYICYTGVQGATETNCQGEKINDNSISFTSTDRFEPSAGLTIAVAVEKGILVAPSRAEKLYGFLRSNYILPLLSFLFLLLLSYYFVVWYYKGRDPRKGIVYPQFSPPPELTPADVGFITEQKFGPHLFSAALIDCAVKKYLDIEVTREGLIFKSNVYNFKRPDNLLSVPLIKNEYGFTLDTLYGEKAEKGKYNSILRSCYTSLHETLKDRFLIRNGKTNKWYGLFVLNRGYITIGAIILIASVFLTFQFIVSHASIKLLVISLAFLCAMLIVHIVFAKIMSAYSQKGREIADHLLGFKMYLEQAEKHIYNQLAPPEKTLELFEKYLPYAIALKVENDWAAKFDSIMEKALAEGYRPAYYNMSGGTMHHLSMSDMSRGISSGLSSTVSSASTPPSSSGGGSSGGGSSGGGGGGGGGGGW